MRYLLVDDELGIQNLIELIVQGEDNDSDIVCKSSGNQAVELLRQDPHFDCIVCDYQMNDGNGGIVFNYLENHDLKIPFVLCSTNHPDSLNEFAGKDFFAYIEKPEIVDPLSKLVTDLYQLNNQKRSEENYCRIRSSILLDANPLPVDIYVRLSDEKFVKLFPVNERFESSDLRKVDNMNVEYLYTLRSDFAELINFFRNFIYRPRQKNKWQDLAEVTILLHKLIDTVIHEFGLDNQAETLISDNIYLVRSEMERMKTLVSFLEKFDASKESYVSAHSSCLCFVLGAIINIMDWPKPELIFKKLFIAAHLHDLTIENQSLAAISGLEELESRKDEFTEAEYNIYKNHPEAAAELSLCLEEVGKDVENILLQHHERPDGSGYPNQLTADRMSSLASIFILAHDIVHEVYRKNDAFNLKQFLTEKSDYYSEGYFKSTVESILAKV